VAGFDTEGGVLETPGAIHVLGPHELQALKQSDASETVKILNLRKILATTAAQEGASKPFVVSIGERAEALAQAYEDRQLTTQQALLNFENLAQEYVNASSERQRLNVSFLAFLGKGEQFPRVICILAPSCSHYKYSLY